MYNLKIMLQILERKTLTKILVGITLASLIPMADFFILLYFGLSLGSYLSLASVSGLSFLGLIASILILTKLQKEIHIKQKRGLYPGEEFSGLTGGLFPALFIIIPGIISTVIGLAVLLIPAFRIIAGNFLSKKLGVEWRDIYEYIKVFNDK